MVDISALRRNFIRLSAAGFMWLLLFQLPLLSFSAELMMVTTEHPPNSFTEKGEVTGANTEMLRYILPRMGYTPVFHSLPAKRALKIIEYGNAHGIYIYSQTSELPRSGETVLQSLRIEYRKALREM